MILGSGIDIIEISRLKKAVKKFGASFMRRVFTDEEIEYAQKHRFPFQHFAARFAAKEAVLKAFGDNRKINWKDIRIVNDQHGRPHCIFKDKKFHNEIIISLAHTDKYAVASAIITQKKIRLQK
ncbi:MAG: holo-ACP synthase [Candidatus Omnitrophota bacterium]